MGGLCPRNDLAPIRVLRFAIDVRRYSVEENKSIIGREMLVSGVGEGRGNSAVGDEQGGGGGGGREPDWNETIIIILAIKLH